MTLSITDQARVDLAAALRLAVRFDLHEGIDNHFSYARTMGRLEEVNPSGQVWSSLPLEFFEPAVRQVMAMPKGRAPHAEAALQSRPEY